MSTPATALRRAIGYLRVSTAAQAEAGMGLDVQRDRVIEYAREHGLDLMDVVSEAASGGVRDGEVHSWEHRPQLLALMTRAEAGDFDVLLVAKLDRLSRDHPTLIVLERMLQRSNVEVVSVAEENGDGPIAEFIRGQLALVAQLERAMIRERMGAGKAKRKILGLHAEGRVPYGYESERGILTPVPDQAEVVKRIFRDAIDGHTVGRIARDLTREGVPTPQGGKAWSVPGVRGILVNGAYAGERYGVKGAHPAIVSRRAFNSANRALKASAKAWHESRATVKEPPHAR